MRRCAGKSNWDAGIRTPISRSRVSKKLTLASLPKSTEKHLKPATGTGLSIFQGTESYRILPKQNWQQTGNMGHGKSGDTLFGTGLEAAFLSQYPRPGCGILSSRHTFAHVTSETLYRFATACARSV
jgi:hypothetical protein